MLAAEGVFVSLATLVRGAVSVAEPEPLAEPVVEALTVAEAAAEAPEWARDVRLFRARLADAFEDACDTLLREFAYAVLGRELLLAPPDIAALTHRLLASHGAAVPLRMRVSPDDLAELDAHLTTLPPVIGDPALASGDIVLELQSGGCVDARIGARLSALLAERT